LGKYETVSIKVPSDLKRRASQLGIRTAEVLRRALEEEVRRREVEEINRELEICSLLEDRPDESQST
jgi:predicted transcriptional regulator